MGKTKENPRYHVISFRVSDDELAAIEQLRGERPRSELILQAFDELVRREDEAHFRERVAAGLARG